MNSATIAIPTRWQGAAARIKDFVERRAASYGLPFRIILTGQFDAGQIYLMEDCLTENERQACETTISRLSTRLNANLSKDMWQATSDDEKEDEREIREIADLIEAE